MTLDIQVCIYMYNFIFSKCDIRVTVHRDIFL